MPQTLSEFKKLFAKDDEEYSDEVHNMVYEWRELVEDEFLKSTYAIKLPKASLKHVYLFAVFTEMIYNYHLKKPGYWTVDEIEDVCCDIMPRKLIAPKAGFKHLPRIFIAFFQWGEEIGIFHNTKPWCEKLIEIKSDILECN